MESLQMLKFSLKKDRLNVNERFPNTTENDMIPEDLDLGEDAAADMLTQLADAVGGDVNDILDRAIAATVVEDRIPNIADDAT